MKKVFLLASFVVFTLVAQAKIWRLNNTPGVIADFTNAQAAHDGAAAGDTIHLEPSPTNYGNLTCTKRLTWLSVGTFLTENPGNQNSTFDAFLNNITMNEGSQLSVISLHAVGNIDINTDNISVLRSRVGGSISANSALSFNTIISQSYISYYVNFSGANFIATNNICFYINTAGTASGVISGNVFYSAYNISIYNSVFQNNIILEGLISFINSSVSYNMISDATGLPNNNGNVLNVNMASVFMNPGELYPRADIDFKLKPGSPAIGVGLAGTDMGAFGGTTPFVSGLQPAIPAVTAITSPAATNANSINVIFSAKSNQ